MQLDVRVPPDRNSAGASTLTVGLSKIMVTPAVASASKPLGAKKNNPTNDSLRPGGHPAMGRYRFHGRTDIPKECHTEYGKVLLAFEPESGDALDAESFGRLGLAVYAGLPGRDKHLRRTQGGLRIPSSMMEAILSRLPTTTGMTLVIGPLVPAPWWKFWQRTPPHVPLSVEPPHFTAAPLDEESFLSAALRNIVPRSPDASTDSIHDNAWSDRSSSGERQYFEGNGGQFGGGGAACKWDNSSASIQAGSTSNPGVDSAGRIISAAVPALVAAEALSMQDVEQAPTVSQDSSTDTYGQCRVDDASDSGVTNDSSEATAY